eukprot:GFYU01032810.1.p1 GENE.GFYU01032810.1~~GFYU01032810.1.p1  ORF type:complete len:135 (+),score=5.81 GFYU01032810.1:1-405(+)
MTTQPMKVLFQDHRYLIVDKPFDVRMCGEEYDTTVLKLAAQILPEQDSFRMAHQLDYATSGVVCLGLTRAATNAMCRLFESRKVDKSYVAICRGTLPENETIIEQPIANDDHPFKMCIGNSERPGRVCSSQMRR